MSFVIFNGLVHGYVGGPGPMHESPLVAFVIANTVGMVVSDRGSRSWAFRNREAVGVAGGRVAFIVINVVSMVIPLGCLSVSRYLLASPTPSRTTSPQTSSGSGWARWRGSGRSAGSSSSAPRDSSGGEPSPWSGSAPAPVRVPG